MQQKSRVPLLDELGRDPRAVEVAAHKRLCEVSLIDFIEFVWHVLEPGRVFLKGWALEAICDHLMAVTRGGITRLIINVPPGLMKSLAVDVFWPAWEWGPVNMPSTRHIAASYSEAITLRDNRKLRNLILSETYRSMWGDRFRLASDQHAKERFENDKTGFSLATSVSGVGTGERGDRVKIDDPHSVRHIDSEAVMNSTLQWFTEVVPTRINDPDHSAIVMIMQRVKENDCTGLALAKELGYEHLLLPMEYEPRVVSYTKVPRADIEPVRMRSTIVAGEPLPVWVPDETADLRWCHDRRTEEGELLFPERYSREAVETLKKTMRSWGGSFAEAGQLQQRPAARKGGMFQRADFQFLDEMPTKVVARVRGWDLAASDTESAAYTAGVRMSRTIDGKIVIEHVVRIKATPGKVNRLLKTTAELDGYGVIIDLPQDPGQSGKSQVEALVSMLFGHRVMWSPETGAKPDRALPLSAQSEIKNLYLVRGSWNDDFINEAVVFPRGTFLDQIDAASRALSRLTLIPDQVPIVAPELVT